MGHDGTFPRGTPGPVQPHGMERGALLARPWRGESPALEPGAAAFLWLLGLGALAVTLVGLANGNVQPGWALALAGAIVAVAVAEIEVEGVLARFVLTNFLLASAVGVFHLSTVALAVLAAAVAEQVVLHRQRPTWRRVMLGLISCVENGAIAIAAALLLLAFGVESGLAMVLFAYVLLVANDAVVSPLGARMLGAPKVPLRDTLQVNRLAMGVDLACGLPLAVVGLWAGTSHHAAPLALVIPVIVASRLTSRAEHLRVAVEHAGMDTLTGLPARSRFEQLARGEISHARRFQHGVTLVFGDVDLFKQVNDAGGHAAGDLVLRRIADALSGTARRSTDVVCRWGGEEFAVLAPASRRSEGVLLAERLRGAVQRELHDVGVTMSFGVSSWVPTDGPTVGPLVGSDDGVLSELLARADRALYAAKHAGRNAVWADDDGAGPVRTSLVVGRT